MFYVIITLVLIGYILNELSKKYSLYNLTYKRHLSKNVVEIGEEFEIATIIENNKVLPVTFLEVIEKIPAVLHYKFPSDILYATEHIFHKTTMFVMPKQRIKRTYTVSFNKRGRYTFIDVNLIAGDFLGTTNVSKQIEYLQEMIVYPRALDLDMDFIPYGSYYGDISVQRWIINDPILTIGVREYNFSEPQKNIHWPSSLKTGRLMVKNFDYTTDNKVMIALNIECSKPFWANIDIDQIEDCISAVRSVMERLEAQGISYGFTTNIQSNEFIDGKSFIPFGQGTAHFYNILEFLGRADYSIGVGFEDLLSNLVNNNEKYTTYILITPIVLEEYIEPINIINRIVSKTVIISMTDNNINQLDENIIINVKKES